jgi:hypothetical protein
MDLFYYRRRCFGNCDQLFGQQDFGSLFLDQRLFFVMGLDLAHTSSLIR